MQAHLPPLNDAGNRELCVAWWTRGACYQNCRRASTHRPFVFAGERSSLLGYVRERLADPAPAGANTITLTQKGLLIQIIIAPTGMEDYNPNWVPTSMVALGIDPDGAPMNKTWSYSSIVGMLLYLSTNTRPDIAFAVSQVARFNHLPKKSYATAVKSIVRYLHRTSDKGMIVNPIGTLAIDCYVDADFAGLHQRDPDSSPTSAKSRTGFIITLGGCPILWKSQLQTEISISTWEAEYSALSMSMRTLLPLRSLLASQSSVHPQASNRVHFHCLLSCLRR